MQELKSVLKSVIKDMMARQEKLEPEKVNKAWKKIVGPKTFPHTKIVYLTKNKIQVNVDTSARLYELNLRKEEISKAVKNIIGVEDIRIRVGDISR